MRDELNKQILTKFFLILYPKYFYLTKDLSPTIFSHFFPMQLNIQSTLENKLFLLLKLSKLNDVIFFS